MTQPAAVPDSVRLAWPTEAAALAELQRRSWTDQFDAAAVAGLQEIPLARMTETWRALIERPAEARQRVLVATDGQRLVGYAITAPCTDPDAEPGRDGEIDQLVVDVVARQRGHGSRLLNAAVDTLRADGFARAVWWVSTTDDALRGFLTGAGWAPDGASRTVGTDDERVRLQQVRLHTGLT